LWRWRPAGDFFGLDTSQKRRRDAGATENLHFLATPAFSKLVDAYIAKTGGSGIVKKCEAP
jgi:hypothetical protein